MGTEIAGAALKRWRSRVEAATVRLSKLGGQGVLVPGGYILTAAHCVEWSGEGGMALGDHYTERVETKDGRRFLASVAAVEPVADVAALGAIDDQTSAKHAEAFEAFVSEVEGVPLCTRVPELDTPIPVEVLTHHVTWVKGIATRYGLEVVPLGAGIWLEPEALVECGTSGGPVVNEAGELVGLVSHTAELEDGEDADLNSKGGVMPVPLLALPQWLLNRILIAQRGSDVGPTDT